MRRFRNILCLAIAATLVLAVRSAVVEHVDREMHSSVSHIIVYSKGLGWIDSPSSFGQRDSRIVCKYYSSGGRRYVADILSPNIASVVYDCDGRRMLDGQFYLYFNGFCLVPKEGHVVNASSYDLNGEVSGEVKNGNGVLKIYQCDGRVTNAEYRDGELQ